MSFSEFILTLVVTVVLLAVFFWRIHARIARRRAMDMVFLRVLIARKDSDQDEKRETVKDFREQISIMEQLLASLKSLHASGFSAWLFGQEYLSLEYVAHHNEIHFYVVVPRRSRLLVEKQIIALYPDSLIEETDEVNIFTDRTAISGEVLQLKKAQEFPIRTYQKLESDSINGFLSALGRLSEDTSAVIQILLRPLDDDWQTRIKSMIRKLEQGGKKSSRFTLNPIRWMTGFFDLFLSS